MKCRDCQHYEGDERSGACLRQRWEHPDGTVSHGIAFANEGSENPDDLDCDMAERRGAGSGGEGT